MRGAPFRTGGVVLALGLLFAPGLARGQEAGDTAAAEADSTVARPFVSGGVYDKPYLTNLAGRTALGGYAEAHARYERVDGITEELGFEARRVNLFTSTRVSDVVRFGMELEIEEGGEELLLEYAALDVAFHPSATLRAGMILSPLGRFNLAHDAPRNAFTDRPLVATDLLGVALSEPGLGFLGSLGLDGGARLTYEIYAVNGFGPGVVEGSPEGTRIPEGKQNFEDGNRSPAVVGRIAWSPRPGVEVGLSGHHGAWNEYRADGVELDERRDVTVGVLDLETTVLGFRLEGEGALARVDLPVGVDGFLQSRQRGFYLQALREFGAGWFPGLPGSFLSAGARVDAVDFDADGDGDSVKQLTLGFNLHPSRDTLLKLNYVRGAAFDAFDNRSDHAAFLFSVATYF